MWLIDDGAVASHADEKKFNEQFHHPAETDPYRVSDEAWAAFTEWRSRQHWDECHACRLIIGNLRIGATEFIGCTGELYHLKASIDFENELTSKGK